MAMRVNVVDTVGLKRPTPRATAFYKGKTKRDDKARCLNVVDTAELRTDTSQGPTPADQEAMSTASAPVGLKRPPTPAKALKKIKRDDKAGCLNVVDTAGLRTDTSQGPHSSSSSSTPAEQEAAPAAIAPALVLGVAYTVDRHFVTNPETDNPIGKAIEFDHAKIIMVDENTISVRDGMTNKTHKLTKESFAHFKPLQILSRGSRMRKSTASSQQESGQSVCFQEPSV